MTKQACSLVSPCDISVVIQGPLHRPLAPARGIHACIASIRQYLPSAEIVVSTWDDEDISDLHGCRCVTSAKPPAFIDLAGREINTNRQIVSTRAGIEAATRPYVLKFRSDHLLTGPAVATVGCYAADVPMHDRLLQRPITLTNFFIRNPSRIPMLFHLSDLVQFGQREDLLDFWRQPLIPREAHFMSGSPCLNPFGNFLGYTDLRLVPEQALTLNWLNGKGVSASLAHASEIRKDMLEKWESILTKNFLLLEWQEAEIDFPQRFFRSGYPNSSVYSAKEIAHISRLSTFGRRARRAHVWLNQYVIGCFRRPWLLSTASILLFSLSPAWGRRLRLVWRRLQQTRRMPS